MVKLLPAVICFIWLNTALSICYASVYEIIPQDKAKIFRKVGETVYFACKKMARLIENARLIAAMINVLKALTVFAPILKRVYFN